VDKQQKLKIALPILIVVMAFVWGPVIMGSNKKDSSNKSSKNINEGVDSSNLAVMSLSGVRKKAKTIYTDWGQNPFMLKRAPKALYIEGIMWDANNPQAIINGKMVGIGDLVESKTVIEIKRSSIILMGDDGEIELKLN